MTEADNLAFRSSGQCFSPNRTWQTYTSSYDNNVTESFCSLPQRGPRTVDGFRLPSSYWPCKRVHTEWVFYSGHDDPRVFSQSKQYKPFGLYPLSTNRIDLISRSNHQKTKRVWVFFMRALVRICLLQTTDKQNGNGIYWTEMKLLLMSYKRKCTFLPTGFLTATSVTAYSICFVLYSHKYRLQVVGRYTIRWTLPSQSSLLIN